MQEKMKIELEKKKSIEEQKKIKEKSIEVENIKMPRNMPSSDLYIPGVLSVPDPKLKQVFRNYEAADNSSCSEEGEEE